MVLQRVAEKAEPPWGLLTQRRAERAAGSAATWQVREGAEPS